MSSPVALTEEHKAALSQMPDVAKYLGVASHITEQVQAKGNMGPAGMAGSATTPASTTPGDLQAGLKGAQSTVTGGQNAAMGAANSALEDMDAAKQSGMDAISAEGERSHGIENAQRPVHEQMLAKLDAMDSDFTTTMSEATKQREAGLNKYLTAVEDLKNTHVYSWWGQASTGAAILGVISQALAGGLQGLTGQSGPTPIDRLIEQDIQKQKLNLAQKSDVASQTGGLYRDLLGQLKDGVMAEGAMRDIAYHSTIERLKALAAAQPGGAGVEAQKQIAALEERVSKNRGDMAQYIGKMSLEGEMSKAGFAKDWAGFWVARENNIDDNAAKAAAKGPVLALQGVPDSARKLQAIKNTAGPEAAKGYVDRWNAAIHIGTNSKEIIRLLTGTETDATGKAIPIRTALGDADFTARLNQNADQLKNDFATVGHLGAISKEDDALVSGIIGMSGGWDTFFKQKLPGGRSYPEVAASLERIAKSARRRIEDELDTAVAQ